MALPSPGRTPAAMGPRRIVTPALTAAALAPGSLPRYKCLCFFHTSFQAGSFCFKNIMVISWLLLNPAGGLPSSFMESLGANISLTVWGTLFALASLS